jgi:hypothetical protein
LQAFPDILQFKKSVSDAKTTIYSWGIGAAGLTSSSSADTLTPRRVDVFDSLGVSQVRKTTESCSLQLALQIMGFALVLPFSHSFNNLLHVVVRTGRRFSRRYRGGHKLKPNGVV